MADGAHAPKALRASIGISHADERRIAVELSPAVAWPTLALAVALLDQRQGLGALQQGE